MPSEPWAGLRRLRRFEFHGSAQLPAAPEQVRDVVIDLEHYPDWWPQMVAVASLGPDDARVLCRSVLPYTLDVTLHAVSRELPTLEVALAGDLEGYVRWTLTPHAAGTRLDFEQVVTTSGLIGWAACVARPVLRWNHARTMAAGVGALGRRFAAPTVRSPERSG